MLKRRYLALFLIVAVLTACGGPASTPPAAPASTPSPSAATTDVEAAPDGLSAGTDLGGPGIDQTKLDVCAMLPRADVEAAIGALAKAPKPIIPIGNEVGCEYVADQPRAYTVAVYNLDRWELFTKGLDGEPVANIGDGGFMEQVGGSRTLYVLLRGRAVVGVSVEGADTPQFRKLVDVALAQVH